QGRRAAVVAAVGGGVVTVGWQRWRWCRRWDERRVRESGIDERIDRETSNLFGFAGKIPPEKFSGGGWWWPKEVDELKAEQIVKNQDPLALMANSNNPYAFPAPYQDQSSFNQHYLQQPIPNPEYITDPTTAMNMALALMAIAQMQMVGGNGGNQFRQYAGNPAGYNDVFGNQGNQNAVQNPRVQNVGNHNGLIGVQ
nr:hypothetical protein [Tanacetum cinerariifolium]